MVEDLGHGFYRIVLNYGFMDEVDIPAELQAEDRAGGPFKPAETSYFLARETLISSSRPGGMAVWREAMFGLLQRSAERSAAWFHIPASQVVEIGVEIEI